MVLQVFGENSTPSGPNCILDEMATVLVLEGISAPLGVLCVCRGEKAYIILSICLKLLGVQGRNLLYFCVPQHFNNHSYISNDSINPVNFYPLDITLRPHVNQAHFLGDFFLIQIKGSKDRACHVLYRVP